MFVVGKRVISYCKEHYSTCSSLLPAKPSWSLKESYVVSNSRSSEKISVEKIKMIAGLAHLKIPESELLNTLKDVGNIIQYTNTIKEIIPDYEVEMLYKNCRTRGALAQRKFTPQREDIVKEGNAVNEIMSNATQYSGYYFKVPKVIEEN